MSSTSSPAAVAFVPTLRHDTYDYIRSLKGDFEDRSVLVTGASKGIGQAVAVAYARAGYSKIGLLARSSAAATVERATEAATAAGHATPDFLVLTADLTAVDSVAAAASKVRATFGSVDILINNAGYMEAWNLVDASEPDDWWRAWEVNVKGTYLMTRAFLPLVLKSRQKTILSVSSAGAWFTLRGGSAYEGTKTAQIRFNQHILCEYGDQGLLAYAVHPGGVKTELSSAIPGDFQWMLSDAPELPADTIVWLTQERREWLADRYISVQWDMEEFLSKMDEVVEKDLLRLKLSQ